MYKKMKRIAIYVLQDNKGIVDDYILYYLQVLGKNVEKIIIVCDKNILPAEEGKLSEYSSDIVITEYIESNVQGYWLGIEHIGWNNLIEYDEVIMSDYEMMGPMHINSFDDMFVYMCDQKTDVWGITECYKRISGNEQYKAYLQSDFICFRKNILCDTNFQAAWNDELTELFCYGGEVEGNLLLSDYLLDRGYEYQSYINTIALLGMTECPLRDYPLYLVKECNCPIIKKTIFNQNYSNCLNVSVGQAAVDLFEYICNDSEYNQDYIWNTLLRTCHQADIQKCLHLDYILASDKYNSNEVDICEISKNKVALFMHLYFDDLADLSVRYAKAMPEFADIYITTNTEEKKRIFQEKFRQVNCNKLEIRVVPNRGRDVSCLLVSLQDVVKEYDFACFYHDKKAGQVNPGSIGDAFGYKCAENVLYNRSFVYRVLDTFNKNPRLGLLAPPEPNHAEYFATLGHEWFDNYENTYELAQRLKLTIPMNHEKEPIAPLGSVFWFRVDAMRILHEYPWKYEDFPEEPLPIDATISHAIERIRPFVVQQSGYYPAFLMVDKYARIEFTNLRQYMRNYVKFLERHDFLVGRQDQIISLMDSAYMQRNVNENKDKIVTKIESMSKKIIPKSIYNFLIKIKRAIFGPHI